MSKWIKQFLLAGLAGLIRPKHNQHYPTETKLAAVKAYLAGNTTNQAIQEMINDGYSMTELTKTVGISRQAYYKWCHHQPTVHELQDREILALIKQLEEEHKFSVGYDKMTRLINPALSCQ